MTTPRKLPPPWSLPTSSNLQPALTCTLCWLLSKRLCSHLRVICTPCLLRRYTGSEIDFGAILDNGDKRQTGVSASRSSLGSNFGGAAIESPGRQFNSLPGALEPVPFHLTKYKEVPTPTTVAPSLLSAPALDNYFGQSAMYGIIPHGPFDQGSTYPPLYL